MSIKGYASVVMKQFTCTNPVRAGIVDKEQDYIYNGAGDYYGCKKEFLELASS
ncbi:MAG: hypothetical protein IPO27_18975 [Bacteroidetes bacterium]|nr:hypothetical protein [Bacteroidota bacterium]